MRARIVRVGSSRAVRLPRRLLEEAGLGDEVEILAEPGRIIIQAAARAGWADAAREMAAQGDDRLIHEPVPTRFDAEDWMW
jgi:antitoxin MazE